MDNDNKQSNNLPQAQDNSVSFDIYNMDVFRSHPDLVYLYKKTEKLVSALYMLSDFISDKEPLKWQIRELGINLLNQSLNLSDRNTFISTSIKFLSFLEVSFVGGVISEMNYKILKFEFENLIKTAEYSDKASGNKSLVLPENFFEISIPKPVSSTEFKGQDNLSNRVSLKNLSPKTSKTVVKDKSNRQGIILSLLKKNKELGIKDFVSSISDCSEKTIQRELAVLVSKGLIRKQGEKRWSRYSIKV